MKINLKGFGIIALLFWLAIVAFIASGFLYKNFSNNQNSVLDRGIQAEKAAEDVVDKLEIDNKVKQEYLY